MASSDREELVGRVLLAGRELSTAAVLFHGALAATQGLSATETKALDLLQRGGPLTAGELARRTGLVPASVTALIGRLEEKGAARRVPHPGDGRKVLVEFDEGFAEAVAPYFGGLVGSLRELCEDYSEEQLATVADFLTAAARRQEKETERLGSGE
ncbi:MarR family transcriptional regulator [Streptomyces sp. ODS28]|uniref:MarR family winged helix-turn-helix transcriptional regulator n=1 Tax=Streptomyces sp. ODS28 TaxID=3136688 RepID=UPI0031F18E60